MPELPEVERGRRVAESAAAGRRIARAWCADDSIVYDGVKPARFRAALRGRRVLAARRRGKQLWFELDRPPHPLFHFGMAGAFHTPVSVPLQYKAGPRVDVPEWPPRFAKIHLWLDDGGELAMSDGRRLGRILLRDDPEREPPVGRLGFDPLLDMPGPAPFSERLRGRGGNVKMTLMDQAFCAGIGNWIADEVLYQSGIDPRRRARDLDDAEARRLHGVIRRVIRTAVAADADNALYPRAWLFHQRWGRKAGTTTARGEPIEHVTLGGRTTAWVPARQR